MIMRTDNYADTVRQWATELILQEPQPPTSVHSQQLPNAKVFGLLELQYPTLKYQIPACIETLQDEVRPNLPWADEHFAERVGGKPLNPPPSHVNWPWAKYNSSHQDPDERFSHTYPERFWPRHAGHSPDLCTNRASPRWCAFGPHHGVRYQYGDLQDVAVLLARDSSTRQAFLPVWFPEDTGVGQGQRVPCSIGYHFMVRDGKMNVMYTIRSCDFVRHFADDVYMACRLGQWMCDRVAYHLNSPNLFTPGLLVMHIASLHAFVGDHYTLNKISQDSNDE